MNQSAESGIDSQKGNLLLIILKALRPHQWIKNSLLIVPLVLAHQLATQENLLQLLFAFISFSGGGAGSCFGGSVESRQRISLILKLHGRVPDGALSRSVPEGRERRPP